MHRPEGGRPDSHFHRAFGVFDATALVAGSMIGSGIFLVAASMMRDLRSAGWLLVVWALSGAMTVAAAYLYGDLVTRFPRAGGQYVYLREAFGPLVGFLYGWTLFLVIQTGTIAAVAVAFARYAAVVMPRLDDVTIAGISAERLVAILLIAGLTVGNARGVEVGKGIQNLFTTIKVATLLALVAMCFSIGFSRDLVAANFHDPFARPAEALPLAAAVGSAMVGALFSSDAWNNVTFAAEEVRDPERTIRRALVGGTSLVVALYLVTILAYLVVLPALGTADGAGAAARGIAHADHDRVGSAVLEVLLGPPGALLMAVAIMISTFGCVNGLVLSGARVSYAMARDGLFFDAAGRLSAAGTPVAALAFQGTWAAVLTLTGTYSDLLDYVIFAALLFYASTVAATFRFDAHASAARRIVAVVYVALAAAVMLDLLVVKPRFTWPGLLIVAAGVPVYLLWRRMLARGPVS